jgi:hypothetical protein
MVSGSDRVAKITAAIRPCGGVSIKSKRSQ